MRSYGISRFGTTRTGKTIPSEWGRVMSYRLEVRVVSRGAGHSIVQRAAYISGERLHLRREDLLCDHSRRTDVVYSALFGAGRWGREELWNRAENHLERNQQTLGREIIVNLPVELPLKASINLVREFARYSCRRLGAALDLSVHGSEENPHGHLLISQWKLKGGKFGEAIALDDLFGEGPAMVAELREKWEHFQNRALVRHGLPPRMDRRSYEEQGLNREPGLHLGPVAARLERGGVPTRIGDINRAIEWDNRIRLLMPEQHEQLRARMAEPGSYPTILLTRAATDRIVTLRQVAEDPRAQIGAAERAHIERVIQALALIIARIAPEREKEERERGAERRLGRGRDRSGPELV
jgi:hypothetical protein